MPMTTLDELKLLTAWESEPVLAEAELDDLLAAASVADAGGRSPDDDGWAPTYDLNAAAAKAWLIKAARAAASVDEAAEGPATSKVFDNCRAMARFFLRKKNLSIITK
ncbi:MAG: hypothetical protein M9893_02540 [Pyrinomonadaceae bacterium]|nr:hypothetical protein [Pyrinomonadaceae bacterium]